MELVLNIKDFPDAVLVEENVPVFVSYKAIKHCFPSNIDEVEYERKRIVDIYQHSSFNRKYWNESIFDWTENDVVMVLRWNGSILPLLGVEHSLAFRELEGVLLSL